MGNEMEKTTEHDMDTEFYMGFPAIILNHCKSAGLRTSGS